ncbi:putative serine/threonine-protein kinase D6PKL1 [Iris pallida]|uniref:Serine/threonine-protein kinase D6PKL1 n=1 Tax=Iris pallida TaxID=29817 RepID=A0AAX6EXI3_IRIPA|nr:putative serine/threonine-protein kinase D6PKL1 [Iris pallida]KAJ6820607.1 putative serine/threonine-protein kinase D6PKL1 [Iris pallida]
MNTQVFSYMVLVNVFKKICMFRQHIILKNIFKYLILRLYLIVWHGQGIEDYPNVIFFIMPHREVFGILKKS